MQDILPRNCVTKLKASYLKPQPVSWIKLKNRGSLFFPSKELVESIHHYEEVFVRLHGENICRQPDPMGRTTEAILKIDKTWPKLVVDLFVKIRFFQRIDVLNSQLKEKHKTNCDLK